MVEAEFVEFVPDIVTPVVEFVDRCPNLVELLLDRLVGDNRVGPASSSLTSRMDCSERTVTSLSVTSLVPVSEFPGSKPSQESSYSVT